DAGAPFAADERHQRGFQRDYRRRADRRRADWGQLCQIDGFRCGDIGCGQHLWRLYRHPADAADVPAQEIRRRSLVMHDNIPALLYLVASVCFIMALRGLSSPETARSGNVYGIVAMPIPIATTFPL